MAYPKWLTPAGNLGIVPELEYYQLPLDSYDDAGGTLVYRLISGRLPPGIQIISTGVLKGIPISTGGSNLNQTYSFTVRVQNQNDGGLADRSFNLTITNIAPPIITPRNVDLGIYFDGDIINEQLTAVEYIPGANLVWTLKSGLLPNGITLSSSGLLSGYIKPIPAPGLTSETGWDNAPWDDLGWQFPLGAASKNFNFTIEVFDGTNYDVSTYKIKVVPRVSITADGTVITVDTVSVDGAKLTVDTGNRHDPIIITTQADLPPERQGSWFAFQVQAIDLDDDTLQYVIPALDTGAFDAQTLVGNSIPYVAAPVTNSNIYLGATSTSSTLPLLPQGTTIQVLKSYTDPASSQTTLAWYTANVTYYTTVQLTGNARISATPGQFITQTISGANATIGNVGITTGYIKFAGNVINASVGDIITQTSSGANATVVSVNGTYDNQVADPYTLGVQFTSNNFITGSGNVKLNGVNITSYPTSVICITNISAIYKDTNLFRLNQTAASGLAYVNGVSTYAYPTAIVGVGVDVQASPSVQGTVGFDDDRFDQGNLQLPTGLSMNINSGWMTGTLPVQVEATRTYDFSVEVYKKDSPTFNSSQLYTLTILGDLNNTIDWLTPSDLGVIENGAVSDLSVAAISPSGKILYYSLAGGNDFGSARFAPSHSINGSRSNVTLGGTTYSESWVRTVSSVQTTVPSYTYPNSFDTASYLRLPQGLELMPTGLIGGRVSFELFSLDAGLTTLDGATTTLDHTYTFSVTASDILGTTSAARTFTVVVAQRNIIPYEDLYLKALMNQYQRLEYQNIISDQSVFPSELIYRNSDPWFGLSGDVKTLFLPGLNPSTLDSYQSALGTNHFNKRLLFGDVKTAVARDIGVYDVIEVSTGNTIGTMNQNTGYFVPTDFSLGYTVGTSIPNGTVLGSEHIKYEVIYIEIKDENSNAQGQGPQDSINLTGIIANPYTDLSGNTFITATPNSFTNMDDAVIGTVGYANKGALPEWMTSVQRNGTVLGFTRATVIAYTKPGASETIAWRFAQKGYNLNELNFTVDRYLLDNNYSRNYDIAANSFIQSSLTSFDRYPALLTSFTKVGTVDYAVNTPFEFINERSVTDINSNGGLDGIITYSDGQTLVFFQQEFRTSQDINDTYNQGWSNSTAPWDGGGGGAWSDGAAGHGWDASTYVLGYSEWLASANVAAGTHSITNQRIGIWTINIDVNNYVTLSFNKEVNLNNSLFVRKGFTHGGLNIYYDPTIKSDSLVPNYSKISQQIKTVNTEFDGDGTRFYDYRDEYGVPESGSTFITFPHTNVFD